jgi:hypothetical protein
MTKDTSARCWRGRGYCLGARLLVIQTPREAAVEPLAPGRVLYIRLAGAPVGLHIPPGGPGPFFPPAPLRLRHYQQNAPSWWSRAHAA